MPTIKCKLGFELCKKILLRLEEALASPKPVDIDFEGYTPANVFYNTKKLFNANLILVRGPRKGGNGLPMFWPTGFGPNGQRFLEAAKDEAR